MRPPFHLVDLVEMDVDFLAGRVRGGFERPGGFVEVNSVWELALFMNMRNLGNCRYSIHFP
jgi:hypothetical protein